MSTAVDKLDFHFWDQDVKARGGGGNGGSGGLGGGCGSGCGGHEPEPL